MCRPIFAGGDSGRFRIFRPFRRRPRALIGLPLFVIFVWHGAIIGGPAVAGKREADVPVSQDMITARSNGFVVPYIPTRAASPPTGPDWVHEIKTTTVHELRSLSGNYPAKGAVNFAKLPELLGER